AAINDIPVIRPFVTATAGLFHDLLPGFSTLGQSAPVLAEAEAIGTRNLPKTIPFDRQLVSLAQTLAAYAQSPTVQKGLDRLTLLAQRLQPPLAFITPVQSTCNYITLALRNFQDLLSQPVATGTRLRFVPMAIDDVLGGEAVTSQQPYVIPNTNPSIQHSPLQVDPYPNTSSPGQTHEC